MTYEILISNHGVRTRSTARDAIEYAMREVYTKDYDDKVIELINTGRVRWAYGFNDVDITRVEG